MSNAWSVRLPSHVIKMLFCSSVCCYNVPHLLLIYWTCDLSQVSTQSRWNLGSFLVLLGTLQQFDEGAPRERSFMAIADAEGMVLAFVSFLVQLRLYLFYVTMNVVILSTSSYARHWRRQISWWAPRTQMLSSWWRRWKCWRVSSREEIARWNRL